MITLRYLQRAQPDQLEDDGLRVLVLGGPLEHARQLVGQQDHEQYTRDHEPVGDDFPQDVAIEDSSQKRAPATQFRTGGATGARRWGTLRGSESAVRIVHFCMNPQDLQQDFDAGLR